MTTNSPKYIDAKLLTELSRQALASPRLRDNHNFHQRPNDFVQRLCIALQPQSYVRPHRHPEAEKWELLVALRGSVKLLLFDDGGVVSEATSLAPDDQTQGVEIPPNTWHTLLAETAGSVILEIKQGPYVPVGYANFADWSPRESSAEVPRFMSWCRRAQPGESYTH